MRLTPVLINGKGGSGDPLIVPLRDRLQDSKRRFLGAGMMSVTMKMSCSRPRSLAEGVRIVFGPMYSFRLRVSAMRTSFSLRNSATSIGGGRGCAGAGAETWAGGATATGVVFGATGGADVAKAPPFTDGVKDGPPEKPGAEASAVEAAGAEAVAVAAGNDASADALRRGIPRAVKTCSTMRAIVWRSGTGADAAAAATAADRTVVFAAAAAAAIAFGCAAGTVAGVGTVAGTEAEVVAEEAKSPPFTDGVKDGAPEKPEAPERPTDPVEAADAANDLCSGTDIAARRWPAGIVRCSTARDSQATRFTFIRCCGPMLSDVMLPPGEPQPSVIAGNKFVE